MALRPPSFRFVLALLGACLVLWGARGVVLNIPGLDEISLFDVSKTAAWVLLGASVATVTVAWMRLSIFAWLCWTVAVASLAFMAWEQWETLTKLRASFAEAEAAGMRMPDLDKMLRNTEVKPGAVSVLAGLIIQCIGLCLRRRTEAIA